MRFPRQAKIFCGPLDPAPVAGMLMLVVMFVLLFSLVYTPGVLLEVGAAAVDPRGVIQVTRTNTVVFQEKSYKATELAQLRSEIESAPAGLALSIQRETGASADLERRVKELLNIQLPRSDTWTSTDNPKTMVEVNLLGQIYYESKQVDEAELKGRLMEWRRMASRESLDLTLVLRADKGVKNELLMRLRLLARDAGIKDVLLAVNPGVFPAKAAPLKK